MDYRNFTTNDLDNAFSVARAIIFALEKRGALRTTSEGDQLRSARAALRTIRRERAKRYRQPKLF